MRRFDTKSPHPEEVTLWAWHRAELEGAAAMAVQEHLAACHDCRQRAGQIVQMLEALQAGHFGVQPSLAQQMRLIGALHAHSTPAPGNEAWVKASARLVRWLAPVVAALAILFVLTRENNAPTSNDTLAEFVAGTPEAALLSASNEEEMQNAMLELMLNLDQRQQ